MIPNGVIIDKVCLIKPAASTHAFNQDQRYVPLTFEACDNRLAVTAPSSARWAPPGDYMLFIVRNDNMPSIARWVRVGAIDPNSEFPYCEGGAFAMMSGESESGWSEGEPLATSERSAVSAPFSALEAVNGSYSIRLTQGSESRSTIDRIRLTAFDHAVDMDAFANGDRFLIGTHVAALSVTGPGGDVTVPATQAPNQAAFLEAGEALEVELAPSGVALGLTPLVFEARAYRHGDIVADAGPPLRILTRGSRGTWVSRSTLTPRPDYATFVVDSCASEVRIECDRAVQVRRIGSLAVASSSARPAALSLASAGRDQATVSASDLAGIDDQNLELAPAQALTLRWDAPAIPAGLTRSLFVDVESRTESALSGGVQPASSRGIVSKQEWSFALGASRPNPSSGQSRIDYSLAHPARVRIRIFDAAGRLVRMLVDEDSAPGPHEAVWDGSNDHGRSVGSGVFFYRMNAGSWQSQRKMLVLQAN